MKSRDGFVSNSSSTSFIITNKKNKPLDLIDFVRENPQLIEQYNREYDQKIEFKDVLQSAKENNIKWWLKERKVCVFGDEQDTLIGRIFDYILRDGGSSKSFIWRYHEPCR